MYNNLLFFRINLDKGTHDTRAIGRIITDFIVDDVTPLRDRLWPLSPASLTKFVSVTGYHQEIAEVGIIISPSETYNFAMSKFYQENAATIEESDSVDSFMDNFPHKTSLIKCSAETCERISIKNVVNICLTFLEIEQSICNYLNTILRSSNINIQLVLSPIDRVITVSIEHVKTMFVSDIVDKLVEIDIFNKAFHVKIEQLLKKSVIRDLEPNVASVHQIADGVAAVGSRTRFQINAKLKKKPPVALAIAATSRQATSPQLKSKQTTTSIFQGI